MAIQLNNKSLKNAKKLISAGKIDKSSPWSFSTKDGNKLLSTDENWSDYESWHLAKDTNEEMETKAYYKYPYGKNGFIYRRGVIAVKSRAAQQGEDNIASAADELLKMIDACKEKRKRKIDFLEETLSQSYVTKNFEMKEDGFLHGRAVVTNVGVFPYSLPGGKVRWELRPPEEVFSEDSMSSLKLKPLTNDHPREAVTSENIKKLQVGSLGDSVLRDEYHLSVPIIVTDGNAMMDVKAGKRALSCGYSADIVNKSGVWNGVPYDAIQTNIIYNHVSIVDRGRAGDNAKMILDSIDAEINYGAKEKNDKGDAQMLKKIILDGVDYEADAEVIKQYTKVKKDAEQLKVDHDKDVEKLKKDFSTIEAERDQLKEENETLKKDLDDSKELSPEQLESAVQQRLVVLDAARIADVEVKEDMQEIDVKKAVIGKFFPKTAEKLDEKDEAYINSSFDIALEKLDDIKDGKDKKDAALVADSIANSDDSTKKISSDEAYQRMIKRDEELYKKNLKEDE